jgi:hypothetical protein
MTAIALLKGGFGREIGAKTIAARVFPPRQPGIAVRLEGICQVNRD